MTDFSDRLLAAIRKVVGSQRSIDLNSTMEDWNLDSLEFFELRLAIEEEFNIEMDADQFVHSKKVRDLLQIVLR